MVEGRVDAHHHVWSLARGDYAWLTPSLAPIYRDFSLADMMPLAGGAGIMTSVLVQGRTNRRGDKISARRRAQQRRLRARCRRLGRSRRA
jgi:predicted TIM-barrel fold metal-dependent hydrolase